MNNLKKRRDEIAKELDRIDEEIRQKEAEEVAERQRKTRNIPWSDVRTKTQAQALLRIYDADKIYMTNGSKSTLQDTIDDYVLEITDCQCSLYFNLDTRIFRMVPYGEDEYEWRNECAKLDKRTDYICVFAK